MNTLTKWLVGGAAVIGGYLLFFKKGSAAPAGSGGMVSALTPDGHKVHLRAGTYYGGRLALGSGLPPFTAAADEETIGKGLSALGWQDVRVYMTRSESPWPEDNALGRSASQGTTRWFRGKWGGLTGDFDRPPTLDAIFVVSAPK